MVRRETKDFSFKIKDIDKAGPGSFVGMAAVFSNVDFGNDVIEPGAFTRTLSAGKKFPVLWQHSAENPIGACTAIETRDGLQITGQLELSDPTAMKAYTFLKAGITKGLSIGYDAVDATYVGDVRHLTEIRLWEASIVTFPMNELAGVSSVKGLSADELNTHLQGISRAQKGIQFHSKSLLVHTNAILGIPDEVDPDDPDDDDEENDTDDQDDFDEDAAKAILMQLQELTLTTT
jgi:uncharacterized protein